MKEKIKIKDLIGDLTYEEIKKRKWRRPRIWRNDKKIIFKEYLISNDGIVIRKSHGNQYSSKGSMMPQIKDKAGYLLYNLTIKGSRATKSILVHRLLWETWIKKIPKKLEINHIDGNKSNNDLKNLETITHKENIEHARINKLAYTPEWRKKVSRSQLGKEISKETRIKMSISAKNKKPISEDTRNKMKANMKGKRRFSKLNVKKVNKIRKLRYVDNLSISKLSEMFKVSIGCISSVVLGYSWNPNKLSRSELIERTINGKIEIC